MNEFIKSEQIGRLKFQTILLLSNITDYNFTEDPYDWVDCYFQIRDKKVEVEIKVRSLIFNTLFMEATKYKEMKLLILDGKADTGLYVNFIADKCYIFRLKDITKANGCFFSKIYANRTTAVNTGKKKKLMVEIPVKLATVLEFKDEKWYPILKYVNK